MGTLEPRSGYMDSIRRFRPNAKLFLASVSLSQIAMASFGLLLNIYLRQLGYSKSFLGIFTTVNLISSGLISVPAGMFTNKFGRKGALLLSIALATVACLGQVFFTASAAILLAFSALRGASNTFKSIVQSPLLVENSDMRERMHLFSVNAALSHVSGMVGNGLAGLLPVFIMDSMGIIDIINPVPLRYALFISALFWLFSAIPVMFIKEKPILTGEQAKRLSIRKVLTSPIPRNLAVYNMFIGFGAGLVVPFFNVFLTEQLQAGTEQVGFIMAGSSVILIFAVLFSPRLVEKFGKVKSVVLSQGSSIPLLIVMGLSPGIWPVTIAYWLRHGLMNLSNPITGSFAMEIVEPEQRATTASLMSMANNLSRAVSATVGGFMMDNYGNGSPYFLTAIIYSMAVFWYYTHFHEAEKKYQARLRVRVSSAD
jgi:MFS family permease